MDAQIAEIVELLLGALEGVPTDIEQRWCNQGMVFLIEKILLQC
jgi:hypothetical protein